MLKAIVYWFVVGVVIELINFYLSALTFKTIYPLYPENQMKISAGVPLIILFGILTALMGIIYQLIFRKK